MPETNDNAAGSLFYLACVERDQVHYFHMEPADNIDIPYYNHADSDDPTSFATSCASCLALQRTDVAATRAAYDHTLADPQHAGEMFTVPETTELALPTRQIVCPICDAISLFTTDWTGAIAQFWNVDTTPTMPRCWFCHQLRTNDPTTLGYAIAYTEAERPHDRSRQE